MSVYDWNDIDVLRYVRSNPGVEYWTVAHKYLERTGYEDTVPHALSVLDALIKRGSLVESLGCLLLTPSGGLDIFDDDERIRLKDERAIEAK